MSIGDAPDEKALSADQAGVIFSISDLAEEFSVTARALRFYEDAGLLSPKRQGLVRIYSKRDRARLAWILRGKRVGFSLAEIREMIELYDHGDGQQTQRRFTLEKCRERIVQLKQQREDIDAMLEELNQFVVTLTEMVEGGRLS